MKRFNALESLRGIAALSVFLFHIMPFWAGYLMVDFFFILSGFILSHNYLYTNKNYSTYTFIAHRFTRLYPLHLYTLLVYLGVYLLIKNEIPHYTDGTLATFIQHLTLTHNIGISQYENTWNGPAWSISVEFWLSILFILVIKKGANFGLGFLALCLYLLIYNEDGNLQVTSHNYFIVLNSGLLRGLASFLLGVITYRLYLTYTIKLETLFGPTMMELAATGACLVIFIWREQVFSSIDFLAPLVFSATIFVFSFEQGLVSKFLRPARYIGQISYSIYLNHIAVIMMMAYFTQTYNLSFEVFFYSTIALVLGYSHLTYCYIEKPMQIKLRNIFSRR